MSEETEDRLYEKFRELAYSRENIDTITGIRQVLSKLVDFMFLLGNFITEMNEDLKVLKYEVKALKRKRDRRNKNE